MSHRQDLADKLGMEHWDSEVLAHAAEKRIETAGQAIADFLRAVDNGWLGHMPAGFNESAFVIALRAQIKHY